MSERPPYRLPRTAVPRRYDLEIRPDLERGQFEGCVSIQLDILESVRELVLNSLDLILEPPELSGPGLCLRGMVSLRPDDEQAVLSWPQPIEAGSWTLTLRFFGTLGDTLRGFYRTVVTDGDGNRVVIASTQCEPTDARRIFPCWDEPDMKAVMAVTLVVEEGLTALSNGRIFVSKAEGTGRRRVRFADTIPMSTYLLAMVVGPFGITEPVMAGDVPVRVAARPDRLHLSHMAREEAAACLGYFARYFGIPYPADKIDHVAIPNFEAGAMENLGLVTYREEALLIDVEHAAPNDRIQIAQTIAHETAHMWFGDLVTMKWWNGIWLNEAFATFMSILACDALHPEWRMWTQFLPSRYYAMTIDGLRSTRPIEFPVGPPAEAQAMFDTLTYAKGAAVLRMLEQYLQPEAFRQGIHNYLERHALGNAETTDLWEALDAASGQSARKVMESWVFQGGYPLVHVERGPGNDEISLRQTPFAFRDTGTRNTVWEIPVVIGVGFLDGHRERIPVLLGAEPTTVTVPRKATWILVNDGGWGYYRSGYAPDLWKRLLGAWPELTAIERYGLAEDVWATVQAGQTPLVEALRLWRTFRPERDAELWGTVDRHLHLLDVMADDEGRRALATYAREIARPLFDALGWEPAPDETVQTTRLRALLLGLLGGVGQDEEVRCEARRRLLVHHRDETALSPSLLTVVANLVAFTGGKEAWDLLYSRFRNASTPQDEVRYLYALGNVKDPELVHRTLDLYQSSEIRAQDAPIALAITLNNRFARHDAWVVIEDHWDELLAKYQPVAAQYFAATMPSIVETGLADRVAAWFRAHPVPAAAPQIAQALEFQDIHRAMARRIRSDLASILTRL